MTILGRQRYHRDEDSRILGERYAGIVIKNKVLLMVHRIKDGYEYYVFPGGHRRQDEQGKDTVMREIYEETGITVTNPKLVFEFKNYEASNVHYYYLCDWKSGDKPKLTGEEIDADSKVDLFDPAWIDLKDIESLNVLPKFAKDWLLEYLNYKAKL